MKRPDITDSLVHFIRGADFASALGVLRTILGEQVLRGSGRLARGQYPVVCFSEAPIEYLGYAIAQQAHSKPPYQPVGIVVSKTWLFARGGRPVIYQSDTEFEELNADVRWRHVRYDPIGSPPIDFTWEREWRICTPELHFSADDVTVVLPDAAVLRWLHERFELDQDLLEMQHALAVGDELVARMMREEFPWKTMTLSLGQL